MKGSKSERVETKEATSDSMHEAENDKLKDELMSLV